MNTEITYSAEFVNDKDFDISQFNKSTYNAESFRRMLELRVRLIDEKEERFYQNGLDVTGLKVNERFHPVEVVKIPRRRINLV